MEKTKCDLSAGEAKLDFSAMYRIAVRAMYSLRRDITKRLVQQEEDFEKGSSGAYLEAEWLVQDAEHLQDAVEIAYVLGQCVEPDKRNIKIANIPKQLKEVWKE